MRKFRLAAAILLAALVAPGTWWRAGPPERTGDGVHFTRLAATTPESWPDGLVLQEAWQLDAENPSFAGFSGLVLTDAGFTAFTDFGSFARFPRPAAGTLRLSAIPVPAHPAIAETPDVEAAAYDARSGQLWLSYEHHNVIRRIDRQGRSALGGAAVLHELGANSGVEAMARLADGRFLLLAERGEQGFVFAGDPIAHPSAIAFRAPTRGDFLPTDIAPLPDGRVLVLLRAIAFDFPPFATRLALGDPATIRSDEAWQLEPLAALDLPELNENYEGLAVEPAEDGALTIWLISDNNRAAMQRTLLLKLHWQP